MKGGDKPKVGIGCTAVYFRYYKSSKFSSLMGVQRKKLIEHLSGKGGVHPNLVAADQSKVEVVAALVEVTGPITLEEPRLYRPRMSAAR